MSTTYDFHCFLRLVVLAIGPKKVSVKNNAEKKKKLITIELKKEIIVKHEKGVRVMDIARQYDRSTSAICTILKKKTRSRLLQEQRMSPDSSSNAHLSTKRWKNCFSCGSTRSNS
ncbi:uncharacterized protein LOC128248298 [Octopus bimaculoides]|uniref:uncharacterized protein LOC128248298 n=1 Tax=Octopus bimaculoides TaxID=37653 RepID=UPI0022E64192|nr:uncharacterized protein LOC128248298 [Octopus bimaculoides]